MVDFENLAVIPARGGSRRIPKKNIVDFFDKPLIAWTIQAAIQSNIFDKVIVSTDDQVIANIAIKYGAEVPFLRDNYADDYSTVSDVVCNEVSKLEEELKWKFQTVAQLMPNCPLRNKDDIISTFEFYCHVSNFLHHLLRRSSCVCE